MHADDLAPNGARSSAGTVKTTIQTGFLPNFFVTAATRGVPPHPAFGIAYAFKVVDPIFVWSCEWSKCQGGAWVARICSAVPGHGAFKSGGNIFFSLMWFYLAYVNGKCLPMQHFKCVMPWFLNRFEIYWIDKVQFMENKSSTGLYMACVARAALQLQGTFFLSEKMFCNSFLYF